MRDQWYDLVHCTDSITQGDILLGCPILNWLPNPPPDPHTDANLKDYAGAFSEDVIVMTQACDLEHDKVQNVVLCPHLSLSTFRNSWQRWMESRRQTPSEKAWKSLCGDILAGYVWNQTMIDASNDQTLPMEPRVVDFHEVFTLPRAFLEGWMRRSGKQRLRLRPPYREHLSQAFARFFMRVGLPEPINLAN
ncbi:hypothetical protein BH10PLA2_BH10PLA2_22010 [soil metagenome]